MNGRKRIGLAALGGVLLLAACELHSEVTQPVLPESTTAAQGVTVPPGTMLTQPSTTGYSVTTPAVVPGFILGNRNRNYANDGLYVENDEWVWYTLFPDYELRRMRPDGTDASSCGISPVRGLNFSENALYFIKEIPTEENTGLIHRMNPDGTGLALVSPIQVNSMATCLMVNDWFFLSVRMTARPCGG